MRPLLRRFVRVASLCAALGGAGAGVADGAASGTARAAAQPRPAKEAPQAPPKGAPRDPRPPPLSDEDAALVRELALLERVELLKNLELFEPPRPRPAGKKPVRRAHSIE
jgi:hypothetical protein